MPPSLPLFTCLSLLVALLVRPYDPQIARAVGSTPESEVFERARRSVFLVETESGHGSGFLVDSSGLIVTNHHVIGTGSYLAVGVDPRHKYPAVVIARDPLKDLALIRVHPHAVESIVSLPLAGFAASTVKVGERVLAIGSAFTDDGTVLTAGMVSQVTVEAFIADLNVNSGTSGGPLLNLAGEVVGICTFFKKAPAGPGLAGIMRADIALPFVAGASAGASMPLPSPEPLPVASLTPYPAVALRERAIALRDPSSYGATINGMRIDVLTPPVVYLLGHDEEVRKAREHVEAQQGYAWQAHSAQVEAIVGIRVVPRLTRDVQRLRLLRNGVEVVPIVPGRFCGASSGCFGLYQYEPEAFAPGGELELHVYSEGISKPQVWKIPARLARRVWSDFAPWLSASASSIRSGDGGR